MKKLNKIYLRNKHLALESLMSIKRRIAGNLRRKRSKIRKGEKIILCYGDSVTKAGEINAEKRYSALLQCYIENCRKIKKHSKFRVITEGTEGVTSYYGCKMLKSHLKIYKPKIIFINFFLNDFDILYKNKDMIITKTSINRLFKTLKKMINIIKRSNLKTEIVFWGPTPLTEKYVGEQFLKVQKKYVNHLDKFMKKTVKNTRNVHYLNLFEEFSRIKAKLKEKLIAEDGIHPNEKGHKKIADTLFKFLEKEKILFP